MSCEPRHPVATTHGPDGVAALRADRARRLRWARGVRDDLVIHSDARIRRACRIFIAECGAADHGDRAWAEQMLQALTPKRKAMISTQDQRELRGTLSHFPASQRRAIFELMRDGLPVVEAALIVDMVSASLKAWPRDPIPAARHVH